LAESDDVDRDWFRLMEMLLREFALVALLLVVVLLSGRF